MKQETINRIRKFTEDRDWDQFHSPANLAKSISIEANELLECFQWSDTDYDLEHVKEDQIKGIVTAFYRKGKWHRTDESLYMVYVHIWTDLLFIRMPIFYIRDKIKRWIRKVSK